MLQALCVSLSLNVWGRLEWTFWTQAITKRMLSCKKYRSAWWVWLRGVSRGGDTMEEERVTTCMSPSPIHLHYFGGFMYCFNFIVCSLKKTFYSLLSNFPGLHACYKVFWLLARTVWSWPVWTWSCSPGSEQCQSKQSCCGTGSSMGEVVVPGGFFYFCCLEAAALASF